MSGRIRQVAILGLFIACVGSFARAQTTTATISGVVRDAQGGTIPGTAISTVQIETGQTRQTTSGNSGDYSIPNLPIGSYRLTASAQGFKKVVIPSIELQVNQEARIDLTLDVGSLSEEVTISERAPLLETETAEVGQVVENRSIEGIALNGRQFWQLVSLTPGASYTPGGDRTRTGGSSIRSSSVNVQINGTGFIYNGWLLDGTDITEYEQGGTNVQPNVDALQEFKVLSANMPAEYGHTPNFVSATMKSGTNQFHGTLFEFLRNDKLDARNFFAATKNALRRNQFGGTVGGPIKRNKLFFFADMERTDQREAQVFNDVLPTAAMRAGDFTGQKTITDPLTGAPFPGNMIPANRISPQATFFLKYMPSQSQGIFNAPQSLDISKGDIKIDAQPREKDHLMGRYSIQDNVELDPNQYSTLGVQNLHSRAQNATFTWTRVFSPKWLNELRFGYYRDYFLFGAVLPGTNFDQLAGITGYEQTDLSPSFPLINISGYTGFSGSGSNNLPKSNRIRTFQYSDAVSYNVGKHALKFGGQLYHQTHTFFNGQTEEGSFSFTTQYTGNAFGDFLLGYPASVFRAYPLALYGNNGNQWALFAQDTYRVSQNLTVNLGLRYAHNPFFNGTQGQTSAFDYATGKVIVPMVNGKLIDPVVQPETPFLLPLFSDRLEGTDALGLPQSIRKTGDGQWLPRVGYAWHPKDKIVLRGAYGVFDVFLDTNITLQWAKVPPFETTQTINNTTPMPTFNWANPFQGQPLVAANPNPGQPCSFGLVLASCSQPNIYAGLPNMQQTYMQQWNQALQLQLMTNLSLDIAYVGNKTTHEQLISVADNVPAPGPGAIQSRRPYPQWGQFYIGESNGNATYNALQMKVEKRFSSGYQMLVSFTRSKCLDEGSNQSGPLTVNFLKQNHAVCDYDSPTNLTISSVYELPFGSGKIFLANANRFVKGALGGWQVAGVFSGKTGLPFTPVISADQANTGIGSQRPNVVGNWALSNPTPNLWFNPAAFAIPTKYTYGNSGRNILRADNLLELDLTLEKNFVFSETRRLQFRAEAFNITNTPTFAAPGATIGSSSAGVVTSTLNGNRVLQGALKFYF
jgi:Carboxypeptidase regulatory-like domain/TonB dependent receptor-like, beta-barrel